MGKQQDIHKHRFITSNFFYAFSFFNENFQWTFNMTLDNFIIRAESLDVIDFQ